VRKKKRIRAHPDRAQLRLEEVRATSVEDMADRLVSRRTGIVSEFLAAGRDATEPDRPTVWRAKLANHAFATDPDESHRYCSGKGFTPTDARLSCLGEAAERYSAGRWTREELTVATRSGLSGRSIDPADLVLYQPDLYASLPYAPYTEDTELTWIEGRSLIHGQATWVPAIASLMEFTVQNEAEFLFPITSNGLAAGPALREAIVSAIYEVIERDAFLITWLNRLPARVLDATHHPDANVRDLAAAYRRRGVRLALFLLPADHPVSVVLAVAFQEGGYGGPAATVGLGASLDPFGAARKAALEVGQVRPAFRERARGRDRARVAELVEDPSRVATMEDHALLYAAPEMVSAFDHLSGEATGWDALADGLGGNSYDGALDTLLGHFAAVGQDVVYVNLTSPDVEPLGVHTARAVLPGFQPIWFGANEPRLAGRRLYELPHRLGLRDDASAPTSLNPLPHPLA
jgi:ribosomal protein S12 methylthiotransferase accessory factor